MDSAKSEIAATAARMVVEEGLEYGPAKRRALRQLGLPARTALPDNAATDGSSGSSSMIAAWVASVSQSDRTEAFEAPQLATTFDETDFGVDVLSGDFGFRIGLEVRNVFRLSRQWDAVEIRVRFERLVRFERDFVLGFVRLQRQLRFGLSRFRCCGFGRVVIE